MSSYDPHQLYVVLLLAISLASHQCAAIMLSPWEKQAILAHGPWPVGIPSDQSNQAEAHPGAVWVGRALFFDTRLSGSATLNCATCHKPARGFTDGIALPTGRERLTRNTQSLLNVGQNRWFGWDGATDSLWAQSLRPMLSPREFARSPAEIANVVRGDSRYACAIQSAFGSDPAVQDDESLTVMVAKALAAYQRTLVSPRTAFDIFRDAVATQRREVMGQYDPDALAGLRIFIGKGKCNLCHFGPLFTNQEFADVGLPHFLPNGEVDPGRWGGIKHLRRSKFSRLGVYNAAPEDPRAHHTAQVRLRQRNWGEFRVPSLRELTSTAPYMHDGSLATLDAVVRHYSQLDEERLHTDGVNILRPLKLSEAEIAQVVAFLRTLSSAPSPTIEVAPPSACLE